MPDTLDQRFAKVFATLPAKDQQRLKDKWQREHEREAQAEARTKVKQAALRVQIRGLEKKIDLLYEQRAKLKWWQQGKAQTPAVRKKYNVIMAKLRRLEESEAALMRRLFDLDWGRKMKQWKATEEKAKKLLGRKAEGKQ